MSALLFSRQQKEIDESDPLNVSESAFDPYLMDLSDTLRILLSIMNEIKYTSEES